jgi:uncharacterized membrane protein YkvA (DUF1232 family)
MVAGHRPTARVLTAAKQRLDRRPAALRGLLTDIAALIRLVRAAMTRRYRALPVRSLLAILAALIYFVNPLDAIPDAIVGVGLLDDAALLGWVISRVRRDLRAFREWESNQGEVIDADTVEVSPPLP